MKQIVLRQTDYKNQDFLMLCSELDMFLNEAIGGEERREKYKKFNHPDSMDMVIVAYDYDKHDYPVGCAALRRYSEEAVEVKRVFVREAYRKRKIGGAILAELISQAEKMGYRRMILETGDFLTASICLYRRYGFEKIENYGAYKDMPESLCMGQSLGKSV